MTGDTVPIHRILCPTDQARPSRLGIYSFMLALATFLVAHAREYDIVHAHQGMFAAACAVTVGGMLGKKTLVKFGGQGANSDFANLRRLRFGHAMSRAILRADRAIATSAAIQRDLLGYGFRPDQIAALPNGVDTRAFAPARATRGELGIAREARVALYVGSLRAVKGVDVLLDAWARVARDCRAARLLIVGDGVDRAALQAQAARLGIADSVEFRGEQSDPRPYYWASDLFVLPSRSEGFPNVILEALAAGLPCVASNVGGIPDQITANENGLLVPPENADGLADALIQLLRDDARRRAMGDRARESARRFDWEFVAPQYVELYRELCAS